MNKSASALWVAVALGAFAMTGCSAKSPSVDGAESYGKVTGQLRVDAPGGIVGVTTAVDFELECHGDVLNTGSIPVPLDGSAISGHFGSVPPSSDCVVTLSTTLTLSAEPFSLDCQGSSPPFDVPAHADVNVGNVLIECNLDGSSGLSFTGDIALVNQSLDTFFVGPTDVLVDPAFAVPPVVLLIGEPLTPAVDYTWSVIPVSGGTLDDCDSTPENCQFFCEQEGTHTLRLTANFGSSSRYREAEVTCVTALDSVTTIGTVGAGGVVTTASGAVSVTVPTGGTVVIKESTHTDPDPPGYSFLGQQFEITVNPPGDETNPLILVFTINTTDDTLGVFKNGIEIPDCDDTDPGGSAASDPCVESREGAGPVVFTVRSSEASLWNFGVGPQPLDQCNACLDEGFAEFGAPTLNQACTASEHCAAVRDCVVVTDCFVSGGILADCYCGAGVEPSSCAAESFVPMGACAEPILAALAASGETDLSHTNVVGKLGAPDTFSGQAFFVLFGAHGVGICLDECGLSNPPLLGTHPVLSHPVGIAIDDEGNVWVTNQTSDTVSELSSAGELLGNYLVGTLPLGIAIDDEGNVWVANHASETVSKLSSVGDPLGTYPVDSNPAGIAIDDAGNVWVTHWRPGGGVSKLSPTGELLGTYPVGSEPFGIAIDGEGNVWVINSVDDSLSKLSSTTGELLGTYPVGLFSAWGIAIDDAGNVWVISHADDSVSKLSSTGELLGTYPVGPEPRGIAVDAAGNAWVVNYGNHTVSKLSSAGELLGLYLVGALPWGIAIDGASNVWVTNTGSHNVSKLAGTALPGAE